MKSIKNRICPVEKAGHLDSGIRRWIQNPRKILRPFISEGMTVLDIGCGPGFFSMEMARMVGNTGRVIAADLQEEMLQKLWSKIQGTELEQRITLHKTEVDRIGITETIDFALCFYLIHELPEQESFFRELKTLLRPEGLVFIAEPPFHVSQKAFEETVRKAVDVGFTETGGWKVFLSKTMILKK
jgi:ubiquinone/menaquinone biosynthesis C-methylase UbiE